MRKKTVRGLAFPAVAILALSLPSGPIPRAPLPLGATPPEAPSGEIPPVPSAPGTSGGRANPPAETLDRGVVELQRALGGILTTAGGRRGRWAVLAVSLDRGDTLLALNTRELMVPASNMKLLTTATALALLGPEFRTATYLLADGPLSGGALKGNLILFGTGDPTLSERFFPSPLPPLDSLALRLSLLGIEEIQGDLVVDGCFFGGPERHPDWDPEDLNDAFAAPVAAVSFNESIFTLRIAPGGWAGARPRIQSVPEGTGVPVANLARTTAAGTPSSLLLVRDGPLDPVTIHGQIPLGGREIWRSLPVSDPLLFAGLQLKQALEARGIRVGGNVRTVRDARSSAVRAGTTSSLHVLTVQNSPPLLEILRVVNKESHNLFAETVLRTLGRVMLGDGSFEGGSRVVEDFLVRTVGVPQEQIRVRDGSGLSPLNGVSAEALVHLLDHMHASPLWEDFWGTLPEAGVRRELGRMGQSPAAGNLRAKTGTLTGVSALSGMVRTRSGERVLFSILSNGVASEDRSKRAEDQIGIRLASLTRSPGN